MRPNGNQPGPQPILLKMRAMERILGQTSLLTRYARALALGPDDHSLPIITRRSDCSPQPQWCEVVGVAVHRRHGTWTHVYSCLLMPDARPTVLLVRVIEGEQIDAAVDWVIRQAARPGALFARPAKVRGTRRMGAAAQDGTGVENGSGKADERLHLPSPARTAKRIMVEADKRQPADSNPAELHRDPAISRVGARLGQIPNPLQGDDAQHCAA